MADSYSYATWSDAVAFIPNLENDATAERLFNAFIPSMSAMIDPSMTGEYTNILSLNLGLHFMSQIWEGGRKSVFDGEDYSASIGPVSGIEGEQVNIKFGSGKNMDEWESDLSKTEFGRTYLRLIKSIRTQIGINGRGKLWASI